MPGENRKRVAISGFPFVIQALFGKDGEAATGWRHSILRRGALRNRLRAIWDLARSDVWYSIGSLTNGRPCDVTAALLKKPRVIHWVGSDILHVRRHPHELQRLANVPVVHLTQSQQNRDELRELGIEARVAPLPPVSMAREVPPLPDIFTVLLYVPPARSAFYGAATYERLIAELRHEPLRFYIVGGGTLPIPADAPVTNLGYRSDLSAIYPEVSMLVRFAEHDGLSLMVLEALSFGRYVAWQESFPFVRAVSTYEEIEQEVRSRLREHIAGSLRLREDAAHYITQHYGREHCLREIAKSWEIIDVAC